MTVDDSFPIQNFDLKVQDALYMKEGKTEGRSLKGMVPSGMTFETLFDIVPNPDNKEEFQVKVLSLVGLGMSKGFF